MTGFLQRLPVLALAAVVASCEGAVPALRLDSIRPGVAAADREMNFLISGSFYAPVGADLGSGRQFLRDDFVAELGGVALSDVTFLSSAELTARMPPGFIEGSHDLVVRDALGREAVLTRAVQVLPPDASAPTVTIDSPEDGSFVSAGEWVEVTFTATDNLPGVVTKVRMTVSGGVSDVQEIEPSSQINPYPGMFRFRAMPAAEGVRDVVILIQAWDDAPTQNEGSAWCTFTLDLCDSIADCDDGRVCNGLEWCDRDNGLCVDGPPLDCDDGIECTTDICDEIYLCQHVPLHGFCDNGVFCDGIEVCEPGVGCVPGDDPCDDGVPCTVERCTEAQWAGETGTCTSTPTDARCDDGLFCNGAEVCDPAATDDPSGCLEGTSPCVEDAFECTIMQCDEMSASCTVQVNHDVCDDNDACTENVCDKEHGCLNPRAVEGPSGDFSCVDGIDNDCDERIDAADPDC